MASKGPRSKLDHESRARRQKALEAPKEPRRPKTHWDHVLEEMIWLSKDFEAERKWKLAQAKKVALRASRGMVDQATRGERRIKEEEQRMRKVALNISKDVKKFWTKIEKLVLYKHQLEFDSKKKKALDKQLEYLLGQTERYSTMLAENLLGTANSCPSLQPLIEEKNCNSQPIETDEKKIDGDAMDKDASTELLSGAKSDEEMSLDAMEADDEYGVSSEDELEDDEQTIDEDEALITKEEREEELAALQNEVDLPLEELLKRYSMNEVMLRSVLLQESHEEVDRVQVNGESLPNQLGVTMENAKEVITDVETDKLVVLKGDIDQSSEGKSNSPSKATSDVSKVEAYPSPKSSKTLLNSEFVDAGYDFIDDQADDEFVIATAEEKDDETTLEEEEELAKAESRTSEDEIALLQQESEMPLEELLRRYHMEHSNLGSSDDESDYCSSHSDLESSPKNQVLEEEEKDNKDTVVAEDVIGETKNNSLAPSEEAVVGHVEEDSQRDSIIADAAAAARSAQPTGNTFSTTNVRTKFPFLIKHPLREYQHIGLDWLVTMYEKRLNGILADEMGLGKTIMTIALLAHLACEKGIWGPHLIVVPTSVMLNWETEFLKWCPAFKILTYFGSAKERKYKRQGWMKPNSFHVCITTYRLVIQDSKIFKRKKWKYLILDEAHLIKNWKSQRWQTLLNFNSKRRILLTGTPLQNDLMELWSLMHFLMPHIFQSHQEFKDWFCNPISGMVDGQEKVNKEVIDRLHNVLRPFILRRLKRDVEKQLPMKYEHVINCRLSKRQRNLYEDFIASSETQATLASSNFLGMLNVIMQLRKVCNHPDLFEGRSIISSFDMEGIEMQLSSTVCSMLSPGLFSSTDLSGLGFRFTHLDFSMVSWEYDEVQSIATSPALIEQRLSHDHLDVIRPRFKHGNKVYGTNIFEEIQKAIREERLNEKKQRAASIAWWNSLRCQKKPLYSRTLRANLTVEHPVYDIQCRKENPVCFDYSSKLADIILSPVERFQKMIDQVESFMFVIPAARAPPPVCWSNKSGSSVFIDPGYKGKCSQHLLPLLTSIRPAVVRRQLYFPDRRLIQFDCGKLQQLAILLRRLRSEGHRALIFTQMTKMLDILEAFINLYGYTYMRLDGSTPPEQRQTLMQRFNTNPKIFLFILSTRSGGVGINLVGADTVIFYDSDWNPAMDQQAQDRCHRIGQTREVHIYRLVSESTIEENILKKANQKRALDNLVIQSGGYNTEFFKKLDPMELFSGHRLAPSKERGKEKNAEDGAEVPVSNDDIEAALKNAEDEADYMALKKVEEEEAVDNQEFTEEAIERLEDDDLGNEDIVKPNESTDQNALVTASNIENMVISNGNDLDREKALTLACNEDEVDMIADVKQMAAAAAAAGQEVLLFENQLRPIDRYAMRFLEVWDPIIDKDAIDHQVEFEEREWELDRIEKLKEDMEAEVDDDDEPLVYEKWDAEFATQAYHQQVEALAQHQLMEELENKAKELENVEDVNGDFVKVEASGGSKTKSKKKKAKKAKFKSLKKHSLSLASKSMNEDDLVEYVSSDYEDDSRELAACAEANPSSLILRLKRKKDETTTAEEGTSTKSKSKKSKKTALVMKLPAAESNTLRILHEESRDTRSCEDGTLDLDLKPSNRGKMGGKLSITTLPMKRIYTIRPEKCKKKGNLWSNDCFPSPDSWLPLEDAVLCALVHEYGPNWSLVSDCLYGIEAGGYYRGRFRHPTLCCERFRELVSKFNTVADALNNEKTSTAAPAKGLLRVTEDHLRVLLDAAMEQQDSELLLQRHFTALLTTVWRMNSSTDQQKGRSAPHSNLYPSIRLFGKSVNPTAQNSSTGLSKKKFNLVQCGRLLVVALHDAESVKTAAPSHMEEDLPDTEKLDVTVEFRKDRGESDDSTVGFPSVVSVSIPGLDPLPPVKPPSEENQLRSTQQVAESRFRASSSACLDGFHGWASSAFPVGESRNRLSVRSSSSGKHKLGPGESGRSSKSKLRKLAESAEIHPPFAEPLLQVPPNIPPIATYSAPDSYPSGLLASHFEDHLINPMEETPLCTNNHEMVPHWYDPHFISDLDDCSLTDYTDIG
ncbi:protein PHOTOPERIOD-INDEPENDENT EARLY FLOWERING 1 isoform X1 [Amaranthus tricolor]|uniref:protein PHOTOPERIOD-INDEPENDENT EARLY FLOWERING 1 isoform X1 n=1 Tax=Amaranthus tricolor TaxID=29722 RepID=UPI00258F9B58|nr:protein PHOTOPERIOD-INDEPENDENT EARLY FLOWERING 1 isoform X1 [Amaranthus tricolor]XP_057547489.1 protein PHOTOPERIOD-INDEPENDENT EARLY FLOWERING 1 isoform X1 [Amaranthus tricolor]XP_057547491.1 protein PHOTOPERIOD-INDEPENDENT EARLY FLOWERING 1 isoform X1 [Amaranthus tricolor]